MARIDNGGKGGREGGLLDCKLQAIDWDIGILGGRRKRTPVWQKEKRKGRGGEEQMDFT